MPDRDPEASRPASSPRHEVETRWDVRIAVRDGVELSANLWLPVPHADAPDELFPAVLEMIPYGKDNWRRNSDVGRGEYFARRGYAFCRVDVRGTGSSGGIALDEYTEAETHDGFDAVEWLAAQPWCSGAVGMWGISYGAFTSIQVAKLRPPHLRAIVPVMGTDDRYLTDVHYIGGCVTVSELSQYAVSQVAMNAMPPDRLFRGETWLAEWRTRLEATPPWLFAWLRHQTDGPYWRSGSLAPEYDAIESAVLNVGGWMDSYVDAAFRMQERCGTPSRTLVGNWTHGWPATAPPGPSLDELHEVVRFFDHRLRGIVNGEESEPALVWFERDYAEPEPFPAQLPGRWRATDAFPHPATTERVSRFAGGDVPLDGRLVDGGEGGEGALDSGVDRYRHRPTIGTRASLSWGAGSPPNGLARDLRPDESLIPTYTSAALTGDISILGVPEVVLHLSASSPVATAVVRLTDVAPDGTSSQVSAGILNLTHRRSHETPAPLQPGRVEEIRIPLRASGYRFAVGHRIRVSVASSAWPVLWPSPFPTEFEIHRGQATPSRLVLPVVPAVGGSGDRPVPAFTTTPPDVRDVSGGGTSDEPRWRITEDVIAGSTTVEIHDGGEDVLHDGRRLYSAETLILTAWDADPARAVMNADVVYRWAETDAPIEIRARSVQASDATDFRLRVDLAVDLGGERFFERSWDETIPRDLV
jgi:putative CocE/NonD family hydrolase